MYQKSDFRITISLFFLLIAKLIVITLSLENQDTGSIHDDGFCTKDSNKPDKGLCCWHYTNPINISCTNISHFEIFIEALNSLKLTDGSTISMNITKSELFIEKFVNWMLNGSYLSISSSLEHLHLTDNHLEVVDLNWFKGLPNLKVLNLSNNLISTLNCTSSSPLNSLETLDLSFNRLTYLNLRSILEVNPSLGWLNISDNLLTSLNGLNEVKTSKLQNLVLHNNPWDCRKLQTLELGQLVNDDRDQEKRNLIAQSRDVICFEPEKWRKMPIDQALSVKETPICEKCNCFIDVGGLLTVNCSYHELQYLPTKLPQKTGIVYLKGNRIQSFNLSHGDGSSWQTVKFLYLNDNQLSGLQDLEISKILRNLFALDLQGNKIREVPIHILEQFTHLLKINLSDNPWTCDCNTLTFQQWLQKNHEKISDIAYVYCANPANKIDFLISRNKERIPIHQMLTSEICVKSDGPFHYLDVISCFCAIGTTLITLKVLYDYFWQKKTGKLPYFFKLNC